MSVSDNPGRRWGLAEECRKDAAKAAALLADMGGEYEEIISETLDDRDALRAQLVENGDDDAEGIAAYLDSAFPFPQPTKE
jgi:hypothetical protein